jgi:hypothetical protein
MTDVLATNEAGFKREQRYIVLKVKDTKDLTAGAKERLKKLISEIEDIQLTIRPTRPLECVVVESDWPEYETVWAMIQARMENKQAPRPPIPWDETIRSILGRPNFTLHTIANHLRVLGHEIKGRAEDEQAAVLHWMLNLYLAHGEEWAEKGEEYLAVARTKSGVASTT